VLGAGAAQEAELVGILRIVVDKAPGSSPEREVVAASVKFEAFSTSQDDGQGR